MTLSPADKQFERLVHRFAPRAKLLRTWELKGGVSAQVTALEVEQPGGRTQKVIARRHSAAWLAHNPRIAANEFSLLQFLHAAGVPVPAPLHVDESGEVFPTPCLVLEYIEGGPAPSLTDAPDLLRQLAAQLAALHQLIGAQRNLAFLPAKEQTIVWKFRTGPAAADESTDERRIRETVQAVWPLPRRNADVLLHGDFWPGNTLWKDGRLVAVIDWEDASLGDPLADLAGSRLEVLWAFGGDAMHAFTQHYRAMNPLDCTDLPYWDLCAVPRPVSVLSNWGLDAATEQRMRARLRVFIDQAFERLSARSQ